jgi:hypothetical protein
MPIDNRNLLFSTGFDADILFLGGWDVVGRKAV